jgi:hypothetical protein
MSNIDKQALRDIASAAKSTPLWHAVGVFGEVVDPANPEWKPVHDFCNTFTAERVLALLDELEAKDRRIEEEICRANREHHRGFMMACGHLKEHSNVHYADAAEMEIAALRKRINELENASAGKGEAS